MISEEAEYSKETKEHVVGLFMGSSGRYQEWAQGLQTPCMRGLVSRELSKHGSDLSRVQSSNGEKCPRWAVSLWRRAKAFLSFLRGLRLMLES